MNIATDISGAVLAGGKSSRMGSNKAFLDLQGKPLVLHALHALQAVFEHTFIVAPLSEPMGAFGVPVIPDLFPHRGPLGGIHAALCNAKTEQVFFVPCDAPSLRPSDISSIARFAGGGSAVASFRNVIQPLVCILHKRCLPDLERTLDSDNFSVKNFLASVGTIPIEISEHDDTDEYSSLVNINTPAEYERMRLMGVQQVLA
jgi:molybdopterin-guanine dinucleotide biosynthesis protein A